MLILFWFAAALAVAGAVAALTRRDAVHALLWSVVSILAVAVAFVAMGAPYVAALQVIVYAGAILVLFVFVVMLLSLGRDDTYGPNPRWIVPGVLVLPPDYPENKSNWPFFWGQNEYVITVGGSYLFLARAAESLLVP